MKRKKKKILTIWHLFLIVLFMISVLFFLDHLFLPPLKEISHMQCKTLTNEIINEVTLSNMQKMDLSSLLIENEEKYTANTAVVNQLCASLSDGIMDKLKNLPPESIRIPIGAATRISLISNAGPEIPFTLIPMGNASVDYETAFSSAGINQVNYKIWLMISMELKIVNPLYQETIQMERKIMLADLIYSGSVPSHYFQLDTKGEYLLTE